MHNRKFLKKSRYITGYIACAAIVLASCGMGMAKQTGNVRPVYAYEANEEVQTISQGDSDALAENILGSVEVKEKDIYKDETVYVFASPDGSVNDILVSEKLANPKGVAELKDKTDLTDIENVNGEEAFSRDGDLITWQANGADICYRGHTDKKLPVTVEVSYFLDGKEITPEDLAGKSGHVTMRFDYNNSTSVKKQIDGKDENIRLGFAAVTGMILGEDFTNVSVTNGKCMDEGKSKLVIGYALPGMSESLDIKDGELDNGMSIPEYVEVSADVTDFKLDMTMTVVMNASNLSLDGSFDFAELDKIVADMSDAGTQLVEGSDAVAEGAGTLLSKMNEFQAGMGQLTAGIDTLSTGSGSLSDGIMAINDSAVAISAGINALDEGLNTPMTEKEKQQLAESASASVGEQFAEGTDTYNQIHDQAAAGFEAAMTGEATVNAIYAGLSGSEIYSSLVAAGYAQAVGQYEAAYGAQPDDATAAGIKQQVEQQVQASLRSAATQLASGIAANGKAAMGESVVNACRESAVQAAGQAAVAGAEGAKKSVAAKLETKTESGYSLVTGANALSEGTQKLADSVPELTNGIAGLVNGARTLSEGTGLLTEGVSKLSEGASALSDGMTQFNEEAIKKLINAYNGDIKKLAGRLQAVAEASSEYDTFTMLNDGDAGTTKFIIKTGAVTTDK